MNILLDLDGVMTDLIGTIAEVLNLDITDPDVRCRIKNGEKMDKMPDVFDSEEIRNLLDTTGAEFWASLPLLPHASDLYSALSQEGEVIFLSAPSNDPYSLAGKAMWIRKHFGRSSQFLLGWPKYLCASQDAILIDDTQSHIDTFSEKGGNHYWWPCSFCFEDGDLKAEKEIQHAVEIIRRVKEKTLVRFCQ